MAEETQNNTETVTDSATTKDQQTEQTEALTEMENKSTSSSGQELSKEETNTENANTTSSGLSSVVASSSTENPPTGDQNETDNQSRESNSGNVENEGVDVTDKTLDAEKSSTESMTALATTNVPTESNTSEKTNEKAPKVSEVSTESRAEGNPTTEATGSGAAIDKKEATENTNPNKKEAVKPKGESKITNKESEKPSIVPRDPDAIKLKFLFANRDGLNVMVECKITDSVGEIKGVLLSMWPDVLSPCSEGERIRLICMGKGILMPDSKSLKDCEIPVFRTHATPINVSVRPEFMAPTTSKRTLFGGGDNHSNMGSGFGSNSASILGSGGGLGGSFGGGSGRSGNQQGVRQGCSCVIS